MFIVEYKLRNREIVRRRDVRARRKVSHRKLAGGVELAEVRQEEGDKRRETESWLPRSNIPVGLRQSL